MSEKCAPAGTPRGAMPTAACNCVAPSGTTPPSTAPLFARYHSGTPIAVFITICAVISVVAAALLQDYTNRDAAS